MDELIRDGMPEPPYCPKWATCGICADCVQDGSDEDPFFFVDEDVATILKSRCGICVQERDLPIVVMLDTRRDSMPCGGDGWRAR